MNRAGGPASPFVVDKNLSVQDPDYADDIALLANSTKAGQTFLDNIASAATKLGLGSAGRKPKC